MTDTVVVVPTYQERDTLPALLEGLAVHLPYADVLVVDDASPDGTARVATAAGAHVLHRPAKRGLGPAYRAGLGWALAHGYQYIAAMDADGSHDPAALPRMMRSLADADLVIGSRYVPGGRVEHWPRHRQWLSRGGNRYVRALTGLPVADATAGFRIFRRIVLQTIGVEQLRSNGYAFQVETALRAYRAGFRIAELDIVFEERRAGSSKLSRAVVLEAIWRVPVWAGQRPRHPAAHHPGSTGPVELWRGAP